jgi:hypothetical protein
MDKAGRGLDKIKCPSCGEVIPVSEAMYHQIAEKTREELKAEFARQQKTIASREKKLSDRENALDELVDQRVKASQAQLERDVTKKVKQSLALELEDLKRQAAEKDQRLEQAQKAELVLRSRSRELEDREKALELETARRLDHERQKVQEETAKRLQEEHRLKDAEKDKKLQDAMKANDDLRRKLLQGSQQTQGEVSELELEQVIRETFPLDRIEPVPKGVNGADILQRVVNRPGHACGTIIWEIKRTKTWSDGWIQKLKDDQRVVKAEMAIIVSDALPKECNSFGQVNGIWVANRHCALNLAVALRLHLIEIAMTKLAAVGKNEKMEIMYRYLSGSEFKQRIEAIVEAFIEMQDDLQEERRIAERRFSKREKQIQRVISSTAGMYGDLQGLVGSSLQNIPALTFSLEICEGE